jgi:hypothetical protein
MSRNSDWVLDEQVCLFDSIRRTKVRARVIRSNKNLNSFDSFEQNLSPSDPLGREGYVQPCLNLGLDARAWVQPNPTATLDLHISMRFWFRSIFDDDYSACLHRYIIEIYSKIEKIHKKKMKVAFAKLEMKIKFSQTLQHQFEMLNVFFDE